MAKKLIIPDTRFTDLLEAVISGEANETQVVEFNEELLRNPAARRLVVQRMVLESVLAEGAETMGGARPLPHLLADFAGVPVPRPGSLRRVGKRGTVRRRLNGMAVAAALVLAVGMAWWFAAQRTGTDVLPATVALPHVVDRYKLELAEGELGDELQFGQRVEMAGGILHLRLDGVADCFVSGRAAFTFVNKDLLVLERGRVRVRMDERAERFEVGSGDVRVLDLGTEFGVGNTEDGPVQVHIFDGEVELTSGRIETPRRIVEGEAVNVGAGAGVNPIPLDASEFPDQSEIGHRRWLDYREEMVKKSDLVFFYDFEDQSRKTLRNAGPTGSQFDGRILGAERVSGRWHGKGALQMNQYGQRVELEIPETYQKFTLAGWFRIDQPPTTYPAVLFSGDAARHGTAEWRISGGRALQFRSPGSNRRPAWTTPQGAVPNYRWVHLALRVSQPNERVEMYVNGKRRSNSGLGRTDLPFQFGRSWLGAAKNATGSGNQFFGCVDEFLMLGRAASPQEIRAMYQAGRGWE